MNNKPSGNSYDSYSQPTGKIGRLRMAGVLLILAGLLGLFGGAMMLTLDASDPSLAQTIQTIVTMTGVTHEQALEQAQTVFTICGVMEIVLSIFPILGGVVALQRKMKMVALIGGILGIFTIGPIYFISTILSLIAVFLIATSKGEFQQK
jgi:hypothetical protein